MLSSPDDPYARAHARDAAERLARVRTIASAIADPTGLAARTIAALPRVSIAGYGTVSTWHEPLLPGWGW